MSKAAQEMQRLADELKKQRPAVKPAAGRRRHMADNDEGLGIEPEAEAPAAAPAEQPAQGEAAPAADAAVTEQGAEDMAKKNAAPRTRAKSTKPKPAAATAKLRNTAAPKPKAAAKEPKAPKPAAEPRPAKVRDPLAGIREKPKLQGVLLGAAVSRAVVARALKCLQAAAKAGDEKLDDAETREVARLLARIEARG